MVQRLPNSANTTILELISDCFNIKLVFELRLVYEKLKTIYLSTVLYKFTVFPKNLPKLRYE